MAMHGLRLHHLCTNDVGSTRMSGYSALLSYPIRNPIACVARHMVLPKAHCRSISSEQPYDHVYPHYACVVFVQGPRIYRFPVDPQGSHLYYCSLESNDY